MRKLKKRNESRCAIKALKRETRFKSLSLVTLDKWSRLRKNGSAPWSLPASRSSRPESRAKAASSRKRMSLCYSLNSRGYRRSINESKPYKRRSKYRWDLWRLNSSEPKTYATTPTKTPETPKSKVISNNRSPESKLRRDIPACTVQPDRFTLRSKL